MLLSIIDVKGDGHCFYRCVWRIAQKVTEITEVLYLCQNSDSELEGAQEVRDYVAIALRMDNIITFMIEFKPFGDNCDVCPLLEHVNPDLGEPRHTRPSCRGHCHLRERGRY